MANVGSTLLGKITNNSDKKAYLLMRQEIIKESDTKKDGIDGALSGTLSALSAVQTGLSTLSTAVSKLTSDDSAILKEGYVKIPVIYNPSSLRFSGIRSGIDFGHDNTYNEFERPTAVTMSAELIFDKMEEADAFSSENTVANQLKNTVLNAISGNTSNTVQPYVEMLLGAMVFRSTRWIGFAWGNMIFWGELTSLDASYTMFDMNGNPVRAKVNLSIREDQIRLTDVLGADAGRNVMQENRAEMQKQWTKQWKALDGLTTSSLGKKASNFVSNLLS